MDHPLLMAAILAWGLLPGLLLLAAARVRWSAIECSAAAPGVSLALVAFAAYAAEIAGLPVSPMPVAGMIVAIAAALFAMSRRLGARVAPDSTDWPAPLSGRIAPVVPWAIWLLPLAIVSQLDVLTSAALLPPSLHDGLDHANWYRLILETRSLDPNVVAAPPLGPAGEPVVYPWGMHAWAALAAATSGADPVTAFTRAMVFISAMLPLSVYVFTAFFTGRGWVAAGAALFALLFWWLPYQTWAWGGYPLLAGSMAALPLTRFALASVSAWQLPAMAASAALMAGLLVIHPSQFMSVLLMVAVIAIVWLPSRLMPRRAAVLFVAAFVTAGLGMAFGDEVSRTVAEFIHRAGAAADVSASSSPYQWSLTILLERHPELPDARQDVLAALIAIGGITAALVPRLRPLLVLHLVFAGMVLAARYQTWLTALWYHLPERIWYQYIASVPALAAAGVGAVLHVTARMLARWTTMWRWQVAIWPLALWAVFDPAQDGFRRWANVRLYRAAYRNPNFAVTDARILDDFRWMRANIPAREILFNAPADWGVVLPFTGNRAVFWSGGVGVDPGTPWMAWLQLLQRGGTHASHAGAELSARGVNYIYAAKLTPDLERQGGPALSVERLRSAGSLHLVYESPTAAVFRIPDVRPALVGITDSERLSLAGFHPLEQRGDRQWRQMNAAATAAFAVPPGGGPDCYLRVMGPDPRDIEVRIGQEILPFTDRGHRLRRRSATAEVVTVTIASPALVHSVRSSDAPAPGVRVSNLAIACPAP